MYTWYGDDSGIRLMKKINAPTVAAFGGILIPQDAEADLIAEVEQIKSEVAGEPTVPVKWNMRDEKITAACVAAVGKDGYNQVLKTSGEWRPRIFKSVAESGAHVFCSYIIAAGQSRDTVLPHLDEHALWAFRNALMHVAMKTKLSNLDPVRLVLDWPSGSKPKPYFDEYHSAFWHGTTGDQYQQPYYAGSLRDLGYESAPGFSNTVNHPLLQVADLVVGAFSRLLEEALGAGLTDRTADLARVLAPNIPGYPVPARMRQYALPLPGDLWAPHLEAALAQVVAV